MAFSDPTSITMNAVAKSLPRIFAPSGPSTFKSADDEFKLEISHSEVKGRRERHLVRITQRAVVADPYVPTNFAETRASVHLVLDNPLVGFTDAELGYLVEALADFIRDNTNQVKFIQGEA